MCVCINKYKVFRGDFINVVTFVLINVFKFFFIFSNNYQKTVRYNFYILFSLIKNKKNLI